MTLERVRRLLWLVFAFAVALLFIKFFVADVYRVSSGSMRPTIFAGPLRKDEDPLVEWVLVNYRRDHVPERFDLAVWDRAGFGPLVKRVVGLPGESIRIEDGDLLIDGSRLPADAARPATVTVFDSELSPVEDYFHLSSTTQGGPWRREEREWILEAQDVPAGSFQGMMSYHPELRDDYLDAGGRRVVGERTINDAILECELMLEGGAGRLRFLLLEKADTFEVRIAALETVGNDARGGRAASHVVELVHRSAREIGDDGAMARGTLATAEVELTPGTWHHLRFANVDNHLRLDLAGEPSLLAHTYERNEEHAGRAPSADQHVGPRIELGGEGLSARFRRIRILRDLHYTASPEGGYGVAAPCYLAPDEVFLLGDNSAHSQDSRTFGPVPVRELIGEPTAVLWPPRTARRLAPRD